MSNIVQIIHLNEKQTRALYDLGVKRVGLDGALTILDDRHDNALTFTFTGGRYPGTYLLHPDSDHGERL
jgi:hypothetical protein